MNKFRVEILETFAQLMEDTLLGEPGPCKVVYDEMHDSEYCRVCEIGSLIGLIKHELEEVESSYASL